MLVIERHDADDDLQLNVEGDQTDLIFAVNTETSKVTITAWNDFGKVRLEITADEFAQLINHLVGFTGPNAWDLSEQVRKGGWTPVWQDAGRWCAKTAQCMVTLDVNTENNLATLQIAAPNLNLDAVVVDIKKPEEMAPDEGE